jgi:hypothetical protein
MTTALWTMDTVRVASLTDTCIDAEALEERRAARAALPPELAALSADLSRAAAEAEIAGERLHKAALAALPLT